MTAAGLDIAGTVTSGRGLLTGSTVLVTGVLRPSSIATAVAATARDQGARIILTAPGRTIALTERVARHLNLPDPVLRLDLTDADDLSLISHRLGALGVTRLDGVVHAVAHIRRAGLGTLLPPLSGPTGTDVVSPTVPSTSGSEFGTWPSVLGLAEPAGPTTDRPAPVAQAAGLPVAEVAEGLTISATSLAGMVQAVRPLLASGSAVVGLTFDSARVWPGYGWMGPLKAALEATARGLAVELGPAGVRVNLVSAGPLRTPAASAIHGFDELVDAWAELAPLGWDPDKAGAVARTVVVALSDWLPVTTGAVLRADGGAGLTAIVP